jgi:hypothetical protein
MSVTEYERFDFFSKLEFDMDSDLDNGFELSFDFTEIPRVEDISQNEINFRKKRGRKSFRNGIYGCHDKSSEDNIIRKIQVNYINFLVGFVNEVLKTIGRKDLSFLSPEYNFKKTISKSQRHILNSKTLRDVFSYDISPKNKTKNRDYNTKICEQIEKEIQNISENILNRNFLFFFDKIFYKKNKKINMKEFGFDDLEVDLKNINLFGDLLLKKKGDDYYNEKMDFCAKHFFFPKNDKAIFRCIYY